MSIKLRSVRKSYKDKNILSSVSLDVSDGEFVLLSGEDNSAKESIINILAGLEKYSGGDVTIMGYDVLDLSRSERVVFYRNTVGFIGKDLLFQDRLNIRDNISLPGIFSGLPKNDLRRRAETVARKFGVLDILKMKSQQISQEQIERVILARTFFMNPKVVLAINPTELIIQGLLAYAKEYEVTVVIASSDEFAKKYASRIVEIKDGKVVTTEG